MKRDNWPVGDYGIRPAGPPDRCLYCNEPRGNEHGKECVIRDRTIVVRAIVEYVVKVPESWDAHQIEFHRNESSWCANNGISEIAELAPEEDGDGPTSCACNFVNYEFVREATAEDEERFKVRVVESES